MTHRRGHVSQMIYTMLSNSELSATAMTAAVLVMDVLIHGPFPVRTLPVYQLPSRQHHQDGTVDVLLEASRRVVDLVGVLLLLVWLSFPSMSCSSCFSGACFPDVAGASVKCKGLRSRGYVGELLECPHIPSGASQRPPRLPCRQLASAWRSCIVSPTSDHLDWLLLSWPVEAFHLHGGVDCPVGCQGACVQFFPFWHDELHLKWFLPCHSFCRECS